MTELTTLFAGLTFPEGPRWHHNRLWFSDFYSHRVLALDLTGTAENHLHRPKPTLRPRLAARRLPPRRLHARPKTDALAR